MDTRYFRDTIYRNNENYAYLPSYNGTILGEEQWQRLEKEIKESKPDFIIIVSSIQVISIENPSEKWANFPSEKKRLFLLFQKFPDKNFMIISSDRHITEISGIKLKSINNRLNSSMPAQ